jgi:hypothetical protein
VITLTFHLILVELYNLETHKHTILHDFLVVFHDIAFILKFEGYFIFLL